MSGGDEGDPVRHQRQGATHGDGGPAGPRAVQQRPAHFPGGEPAGHRL